MSVSYNAFGELRVTVQGATTSIGRRREREVLATLIAARGTAVPPERLATDLWGPDAGPKILGLVQVAVSRLRSLIEPDRPARGGRLIASSTAGYLLQAEADDVDVWRYEDLARQVLDRTAAAQAVRALCEEAAALWAPPYAGVDAPAAQHHAERLRELQTDLLSQHARALLDLGHPDAAVRLLSDVVEDHPYREALWCLHALSLYRGGRQDEALHALRQLRRTLADDLGVDPVAETLALEDRLLRQDEAALSGRLLAAPSVVTHRRPLPGSGLVGRSAELAAGTELLAEAVEEQSTRFLLVAGEPGIGKSAWLRELARHAEERGFEVLAGHNYEDDLAPALWPWIEIIRPVLDEAPGRAQEVLRPTVWDTPDARGPMLAVYEAVLELLADRARRRPLLVLIEDLGHADTATLRLLRHVADAPPDVPMVVAASRRTTDEPGRALLAALASLSRAGVARVRLDGLPVDAVGELISAVAGPHGKDLDRHVTTLTGGNPFFVRQYAALLAEQADLTELDPTTLTVPDGVRAVLRERISLLPAPAVPVLLSASVLGRTVLPEVLATLVDQPVEEVLSCLDVGVAAGLLVDDGPLFTFVHALAVDTAYEELSAARRIRLHDRASRVLEEHLGPGPDTVTAIAAHAWAAADLSPEHRERAATWRARAAGMALTRHAWAEALAWWVDTLSAVPGSSEAAARAHQGAATALLNLNRVAEAQHEIEHGTRVAHALRSWELVTELVATQAEMAPWSWPDTEADRLALATAIDEALEHVSQSSQALLLTVRDINRLMSPTDEDRGQDTARALELARATGVVEVLQRVLVLATVATEGCWSPTRRLDLVHELLATGPEGDMLVGALFLSGIVEWENGRPAAADAAMDRTRELARGLGFSRMQVPLAWWEAVRARDRDAEDASALLDTAMERHRHAGWLQGDDVLCLALARRDGGRHVLAGLSDCPPPRSAAVGALLAHAVLESGEPELARRYLDAVVPTRSPQSRLAAQCFRLLVLARTGTTEEVRAALAPLEVHRGEPVPVHHVLDHAGVVDHFLAAGYAAVGDPRAADVAAEALRANEALGCLPWARRSAALLRSLGG